MSLINNTFSPTQSLNFNVKTPSNTPLVSNRQGPLVTGRISKAGQGNVTGPISVGGFLNHTIVVSPQTVNQTYTLPTASQILSEFGKSIDTGVPKLNVGDSHILRVVNRG